MGGIQTKLKKTKESRQAALNQRQAANQNTKNKIQNMENQFVKDNALTEHKSNITQIISVAEAAKVQLDRDGAPLTKTDLIAIVMALQPGLPLDEMGNNTVKDLNAVIRNIVYDPERYFHSATNTTNQISYPNYPAIMNTNNTPVNNKVLLLK